MKRPDILIVKPGSQRQLYQELGNFSLTAIEPPLWGALLAAYLREQGFDVAILDAEAEALSYEETAEMIRGAAPHLTLVSVSGTNPSASTMNMTGAGAVLAHLRRSAPELRTALSGLHVTALPERSLVEEPCDFVVRGEGFHTLPCLISSVKSGTPPDTIPGLAYRDAAGVPRLTPMPALIQDLDSLPMPAWDLLPMGRYRAHNWHCFGDIENRAPYGVVYTSLGCPFRCAFCCINALFGRSGIRYRSPESVTREIDFLVTRYGIRNLKIIDEMFALSRRHVTAICDELIERKYDLNIWAYARVNTVSTGMLAKMRAAGIRWIAYGFESGSERVLRGVSKGCAPEQAVSAARMTREAGIHINGNYIFGLPDDDADTLRETLSLAESINSEWANLYSAMAYPGSRLYEDARQRGIPLPRQWADYSQYAYDAMPLPTRHLTADQVIAFRDAAFRRYHSRPAYLAMIERTFGAETRAHIETMTRRALPRRHHDETGPGAPSSPL